MQDTFSPAKGDGEIEIALLLSSDPILMGTSHLFQATELHFLHTTECFIVQAGLILLADPQTCKRPHVCMA